MRVVIVSPEKTLFEGEATRIKVPGVQGAFEVLNNHAPIISILSAGKVECDGVPSYGVSIKSGFIEVAKNNISICVEL